MEGLCPLHTLGLELNPFRPWTSKDMWSRCIYLKILYTLNISLTWCPPPAGAWFNVFSFVNLDIHRAGLRVLFKKWWQITNKNQKYLCPAYNLIWSSLANKQTDSSNMFEGKTHLHIQACLSKGICETCLSNKFDRVTSRLSIQIVSLYFR